MSRPPCPSISSTAIQFSRTLKTRWTRMAVVAAFYTATIFPCATAFASKEPDYTSSDFVYRYLLAEIAGQRGNLPLAAKTLTELARKYSLPELAERATNAALYGNLPKQAMESARVWAQLSGNSPTAVHTLTDLLIRSSDPTQAIPFLSALLVDKKKQGTYFFYLIEVMAQLPNKKLALSMTKTLTQPYPQVAEAHFALAHSAWANRDETLALNELAQVEKIKPGWEPAAQLNFEILLQNGHQKALAYCQQFLEKYPDAISMRVNYTRLLVQAKQTLQASAEITKLTLSKDQTPELAILIALLSGDVSNYRQAEQYFELALKLGYPDHRQVWFYLGQATENQQKYDQALSWYERALNDANRFDVTLRMAYVLIAQKKYDEALNRLNNLSADSNTRKIQVIQLQASILILTNRINDAYKILQNAVENMPNTESLVYDYALTAEKIKAYDVMESQLRKLMVMNPSSSQAYNALGYSLADRNLRLAEAQELIKKALTLSPDDAYILDSMGWVQYRLNNLDGALSYLKKSYAKQPEAEVAAHLGEVLWKKGLLEDARSLWREASQKWPLNQDLIDLGRKISP